MVELKNKKIKFDKLSDFGFLRMEDGYVYTQDIAERQLVFKILIDSESNIKIGVFDSIFGDEYMLHCDESNSGAFVGRVRAEVQRLEESFVEECIDNGPYHGNQVNLLLDHIVAEYEDVPEFPWDDESCVVRRSDNRKWYVIFMKISSSKLGLNSTKTIEVMNVKMRPEDVVNRTDNEHIFRAYHMNKKHWITVPLDGRSSMETLQELVADSRNLVKKRGKSV